MNALQNARRCTEQSETIENMGYAQMNATLAFAYAAIAQAESLATIAGEMVSLGNTMRLIASLETEIVLDLRSRRAAERASHSAYGKILAQDEMPT